MLLCFELRVCEEMRLLLVTPALTTLICVLSLRSIQICPLRSAHSAGTYWRLPTRTP